MTGAHLSAGPRELKRKTRCLTPVRGREDRPCWRPWGHAAGKHMSRDAWLRKLEQNRGYRSRSARVLKPCGTEAAYRRHLRRREVPCEPCRLAANTAAAGYRQTRLAGAAPVIPVDRNERN
jgi:hypothetical protein